MCGRFTLTKREFRELVALLGVDASGELAALYCPRYNIAPTDQHWLLRMKREDRELLPATWGLVNSWAKDAKAAARQINARSETAPAARAFREAFARRRCAVPADGFFEWRGARDTRQPIWYHRADAQLILFAGLYESWLNPETNEWQRTFTILTTDANETVAPVHDRMPVILPDDRVEEWLFVPPEGAEQDVARLRELLQPAPSGLIIPTPVNRRVNNVKNDDPACLDPVEDEAPGEQKAEQGRLV